MPLLPHTRIVRPEPVILVADDDRDTRELYRACFDTSGFRTAEAGTGSQAIVSAVELVPDILLTDYVLPDIDGLTIARRLKGDRRTAGIRILMVTGYGNPDLERHAADAGIERVLLKPCLPHARLMAHSKDPPKRDDITDPREVLLLELAAAREDLRLLIEKMKRERLEWEVRLEELQRSSRLTPAQKAKLRRR